MKGSPFDEKNRLLLDRVKSIKSPLAAKELLKISLVPINRDKKKKSCFPVKDVNYRPLVYETSALTTELTRLIHLTIGSCFSVHYRVMEHTGSLESTKEA